MEDRVCLCQHRAQHRGQKEEQEERREERREETQGSGWHRNCFWGFTYANALSEDNDDRLMWKFVLDEFRFLDFLFFAIRIKISTH